jgi:hypothetical protein
METAILVQTDHQVLSERHPFLPVASLRLEADNMMKSMVTLAKSLSLASVNIMACVSSLLNIAKKRVDYVEFAVEVIHSLSYNLLESFTESQKNSIRKQLKVMHQIQLSFHWLSLHATCVSTVLAVGNGRLS